MARVWQMGHDLRKLALDQRLSSDLSRESAIPAEFERCVKQVKAKGKVRNAYAVCRSSMGSDKEIAARRKKKPWPPK